MNRDRWIARVGLVVLLLCGAARGDETQDIKEQAKQHYLRGNKFFDLTHYDEAIVEYEAAYELKADAVFIYNIAQCHRLAGHFEKSIRFYRNYLRLQTNSPVRADVDARIREMEHALETGHSELQPAHSDSGPAPKSDAPAKTSTQSHSDGETRSESKADSKADSKKETRIDLTEVKPEPKPEAASGASSGGALKAVGAVLLVVGAGVAIGGGLGFFLAASSTANTIANEATYMPSQGASLTLDNTLTAAMAVGGGVLAAVGAAVLVVGLQHHEAAPAKTSARLMPSLSNKTAGLVLSGSF